MIMQFKLQRDLPKDPKAAEIVRLSKLAGDFIKLNKVIFILWNLYCSTTKQRRSDIKKGYYP